MTTLVPALQTLNHSNQPLVKKANRYNIYIIPGLLLSVLGVYYTALAHDFQKLWDDQWVVINYYTEGGWGWDNIWIILTDFYHGQYAPVNQLYYTALYSLFGYNPFWFHAGSVLVHMCNVILCYSLITRLLFQVTQFEEKTVIRIAFLTALLFAVHPFLVEAVAWVSASKVVLYALFYLIALHFYLTYINKGKGIHYALTLVFFIISFGAKEQAVTLPVCLLLIDTALRRNFNNKQIWLEKAPFFVLALFFGILTFLSQGIVENGALAGKQFYPFYQRIALSGYTLSEYFFKCVLPVKLSYIYPFPMPVGAALPVRFYFYCGMVLLAIAGLFYAWRINWLFFGFAFFLIHVAIVLNFISLSRFTIVADRYVYLASIGLFFIMACLLNNAVERYRRYWKGLVLVAVLYVLSLGLYAHQRCLVWRNSITLKKEIKDLLKQNAGFNSQKQNQKWELTN